MKQATRAFTLIELLVVVAIITLLIAILLPSLSRAKDVAEAAVCGTNLKQIHLAWHAYSLANRGALSTESKWVTQWHNSDNKAWAYRRNIEDGQLFKYVGETYDVYACQTFKRLYQNVPGNENYEVATSYSISIVITDRSFVFGSEINRNTQFKSPASLLVFADENAWGVPPYSNHGVNDNVFLPEPYDARSYPWGPIDAIGSYHVPPGGDINDGSANVAFADGHVALHHISEYKELIYPDADKF